MTDIFPSRANLVNNKQSHKYSENSFSSSIEGGKWLKNEFKNDDNLKQKSGNKNSSSKKITKPFKEDELKDNYGEVEYNDRIRRLSKREKIVYFF
jgi:hypothetical protein